MDMYQNGCVAEAQSETDILRAEIHMLKTAGMCEVASRNPSVAEYMQHWEGRVEKAEARVAELEAALVATATRESATQRRHDTKLEGAEIALRQAWNSNWKRILLTRKMRAALEWYGEQARLCRLIHSGGDAGRHALNNDGGKRAREVLEYGCEE